MKAILVFIADCVRDDGTGFWKSKQTIALATDFSRQTVIRLCKELEDRNLILKAGERGSYGRMTIEYRLNIGLIERLPLVTESDQSHSVTSHTALPHQSHSVTPPVTESYTTPPLTHHEPSSNRLTSITNTRTNEIMETWNAMASQNGLSKVKAMTAQRRKACQARITDYTEATVIEAIQRIPSSSFLLGRSGGWSANFDFLMRPDSILKIIEGKYDDKKPASNEIAANNPGLRAILKRQASRAAERDERGEIYEPTRSLPANGL